MLRSLTYALMALTFVAASASYTVIDGRLDDSAIYPATYHTYKIVVPDGYDASRPACLYLGLDGILCRAPEVLDSLMATGDVPLTIGVYLQPGLIRDASGRVVRYNRSNEFDATDGRFASFLERELLPAVEATVTPDGRRVRLSADPADRCIFGLSSGGIAAFNAAWHRPDLFGRVYSGCGTFVPMRGGHDLEAIVRKHEPLPLRVFLQDGFSDTWNPTFGSWYEHNRLLASALEFAGYDCAFDWAEGGHSVVRTSAIFPEVMKWIWRGYPAAPAAGTTANNTLAPLLDGCPTRWEPVVPPALDPAGDMVYYPDSSFAVVAEITDGHIDQCLIDSVSGAPVARQRFYWPHSYNANAIRLGGMAFDAAGLLWAVTSSGLQVFDQNGRVRAILRLPDAYRDADLSDCRIVVGDGSVILTDGLTAYRRQLRVAPPEPGVTPPSQGQG